MFFEVVLMVLPTVDVLWFILVLPILLGLYIFFRLFVLMELGIKALKKYLAS